MSSLLFLGGIFFIAMPLISLVMVISANRQIKRINRQVETLSAKITGMENAASDASPAPDALQQYFDKPLPEDAQQPARKQPEQSVSEPVSQATSETENTPENQDTQDLIPDYAKSQTYDAVDEVPGKSSLESMIGGNWSVILGGITLSLGLIFMVQYSIESGILGPGPRLVVGAILSALLLASGEWLRRSDRHFNLPVYRNADGPGILTAAGAIGAFGVIYASHALYGFIGPATAFIGLTVMALLTLLLSAIHGPKLAAIGVLGSYATPLLVDSQTPNPLALALHVVAVTIAVMGIARLRNWTWLAVAGSIFSCLWIMIAAVSGGSNIGLAGSIMLIAIAAIFTLTYGLHEFRQQDLVDVKPDQTVIFTFTIFTLAFLFQLLANHALPETATALLTAIIIMSGAVFSPTLATTSVQAACIVLVTLLVAQLNFEAISGLTTTRGIVEQLLPVDTIGFIQNAALLCVPPALIAAYGAWTAANPRPKHSGWLASVVSALAFFSLLFVYLRIAPFETRPLIGTIGIVLSALLLFMSEAYGKWTLGNPQAPAPAALLVGVIATLSLSFAIGLDVGWLPLAFSLTALGVAFIYFARPFVIIPYVALASGVCACIALFLNMPLEYPQVSSTLVFNGLLLLVFVPAVCLLVSGESMRLTQQAETDFPANALTAIGLAVLGLFLALEVTHIVNDGDLASARQSLAETSGHALAALFMAFGLRRIAIETGETVFTNAFHVATILSVMIMVGGLLYLYNPFLTNESVGEGLFLNLLLPGYLLTGIAALCLALYSRGNAPLWYTLMYAGLGGALLFTYSSLMLRKAFQGEFIAGWKSTSDLEFWLYSPLWLMLGGLILALGLRYKSTPMRAASALLIMLTIVKVFVLDMEQLQGFLRAASFIGLGISLIVVGRFYQRLLTKSANAQSTA